MIGKLITRKFEILNHHNLIKNGEISFMKKENRDKKVIELIQLGYLVVKDSITNQYVNPQYINDYPYSYETGFGNTDYHTYFSVIYHVRYYTI